MSLFTWQLLGNVFFAVCELDLFDIAILVVAIIVVFLF